MLIISDSIHLTVLRKTQLFPFIIHIDYEFLKLN